MVFDVIFVHPYPFSDHPCFPEGILKRALKSAGFTVGVIEQPFWQSKESFARLGRPRLFFALISGPMDSMVLNYTSLRKRRREDLYQPGGIGFFKGQAPSVRFRIRPDRTLIVFSNRIRETFREAPIVIGGIEASLRRFAHYDFQQDQLRRSILLDSRADLLVYGMGEKQITAIARNIQAGSSIQELSLPGTTKLVRSLQPELLLIDLPSFDSIQADPKKLLEAQLMTERAAQTQTILAQQHGDRHVLAYPPMIYQSYDLDFTHELPYVRNHPNSKIISPALQMNLFSVTSHRGCGGACSFCAISAHDGKRIISRSVDSILREIHALTKHPSWKGSISNLGGASVEMYGSDCNTKTCVKPSCMFPRQCEKLSLGLAYLELLRHSRKIKGVKQVLVGSGIRFDLLLRAPKLLEEIMRYHSGRFLRVAPEHTEDSVLKLMRKPSFEMFEEFVRLFRSINKGLKRKIELAAYLIVGHPGESLKDVISMRGKLRKLKIPTTDTQIFTPSPGTLSTAMYYAGCTTTSKQLDVAKEIKELAQRKKMITLPQRHS